MNRPNPSINRTSNRLRLLDAGYVERSTEMENHAKHLLHVRRTRHRK
jgi:hypothetical protein